MVLFSGLFHKHSSYILKEGVSLKKSSSTKFNGGDAKDSCLLSHSSTGAMLLHEQEKISFEFSRDFHAAIIDGLDEPIFLRINFSFSLRGPPVV